MYHIANGVTFSIGEQLVGGLTKIGGADISRDTADVTTLDNTSGYREFLGEMLDAGDLAVEGFYDPEDPGILAMMQALENPAPAEFSVGFPAKFGMTWGFQAIVTNLKIGDLEAGKLIPFSSTLKISGRPELTSTAAAQAEPAQQSESTQQSTEG